MDLQIIRKNLKRGDQQRIADSTELSVATVRKVLYGDRNNQAVLDAAINLAFENIAKAKEQKEKAKK